MTDIWKLNRERQLKNWDKDVGGVELEFQKAVFQIHIEYAGGANYGWDYGIAVSWDNPRIHRSKN